MDFPSLGEVPWILSAGAAVVFIGALEPLVQSALGGREGRRRPLVLAAFNSRGWYSHSLLRVRLAGPGYVEKSQALAPAPGPKPTPFEPFVDRSA